MTQMQRVTNTPEDANQAGGQWAHGCITVDLSAVCLHTLLWHVTKRARGITADCKGIFFFFLLHTYYMLLPDIICKHVMQQYNSDWTRAEIWLQLRHISVFLRMCADRDTRRQEGEQRVVFPAKMDRKQQDRDTQSEGRGKVWFRICVVCAT